MFNKLVIKNGPINMSLCFYGRRSLALRPVLVLEDTTFTTKFLVKFIAMENPMYNCGSEPKATASKTFQIKSS